MCHSVEKGSPSTAGGVWGDLSGIQCCQINTPPWAPRKKRSRGWNRGVNCYLDRGRIKDAVARRRSSVVGQAPAGPAGKCHDVATCWEKTRVMARIATRQTRPEIESVAAQSLPASVCYLPLLCHG